MPPVSRGRASTTGGRYALLVVLGLLCQEVGASCAVWLFPQATALGVVFLRLFFSAVVLLAVARPRLRGIRRQAWLTVVAFGLALAVMNSLFYLALDRIPLGATVTIEALGPLVLSMIVARRAVAWLWAALGMAGVALLGDGSFGHLELLGVLLAAGAGTAWAFYILLSRRTGRAFGGFDGLSIAMAVGAIATAPLGVVSAGAALLHPAVLGLGLAVALLSSTIPYGLELIALRHVHPSAFAILMCLAPAVAAFAGVVLLHQPIGWLGVVAIGLVVAASIGAVRTSRGAEPVLDAPEDVA
jgi:inner membrane transporter RhtA